MEPAVGRRVGKTGCTGANGLPAERELPETSSKNRLMHRVENSACRMVVLLACELVLQYSPTLGHVRSEPTSCFFRHARCGLAGPSQVLQTWVVDSLAGHCASSWRSR